MMTAPTRCSAAIARVLLAVSLCLVTPLATAVTVHTWVDEAGIRHYADAPPAADAGAESFEIADSAPAATDDYYSVTNQWARVRAEREADAARRAQAAAAARAAAPPAWAPPVVVEQRGGWIPAYPGYYGALHGRAPYGGHGRARHGGGDRDRAARASARRGGAFVPEALPAWPREGAWPAR